MDDLGYGDVSYNGASKQNAQYDDGHGWNAI